MDDDRDGYPDDETRPVAAANVFLKP